MNPFWNFIQYRNSPGNLLVYLLI